MKSIAHGSRPGKVSDAFSSTLKLLGQIGAVRLDAIYVTPEGPVLYANIVSEIVIACPYTLLALAGSAMLLYAPEDEGEMKEPLTECGFGPSSSEII